MVKIQILTILIILLAKVRSETCPSVGDVRVFNNNFTGATDSFLQVCLDVGGNKTWSYICSQDMNGTTWSIENRYVWCRSRDRIYPGRGVESTNEMIDSGDLKLTNVTCNRTLHAGLIDCNYTTTSNACKYLHGLRCDPCFENSTCYPGFCAADECRCLGPCMNGGFCDLGRCQCQYPYEGDICQYRPCEPPCSNDTVCQNSTGTCEYAVTICVGNCPTPCPTNETCDPTNGTEMPNRTNCTDCSNCTDIYCTTPNSTVNPATIYIGISAGIILFLILCIIAAGSTCCIAVLSKRNSSKEIIQKNTQSVENGSVLDSNNNTIEMSETGLKSKRKLKENASYIRDKKLINGNPNIPHELHFDENEHNTRSFTPDPVSPNQKYTLLSSSHYYSQPEFNQESSPHSVRTSNTNEYEEIYKVFLNGEGSEEQLYEIYSKINENELPSRNATIVLSQEERNSVNLQQDDIIYETCIQQTGRKDTSAKFFTQNTEYCEPPHDLPKIFDRMSSMKFREINPDTLTKKNYLGSGEFGTVHNGIWKTGQGSVDVAIKELNQSSREDLKTAFMKEAAIMGQFSHPNILRLLGILSLSDPFMIVTELMKSELLDVLLSFNSSGIDLNKVQFVLLKFCREIGEGMRYLASKKCVHRDLAARNVLLTKNMVCKIADFGMSREFKENYDYYKSSGGLIPVKWTSPEAIFYRKYTEKSDVWAFGMTMFEIWSLGYKPWHNKSNQEIVEMMQAQKIISPPTGCPQEIYEIMLQTWKYDVEERCTFTHVCQLLGRNFVFKLNRSKDPQYVLGNDPSLVKDFQ